MADCCQNVGKCLFFIFNAIFWILGICFLAMGIATLAPGKIHDVMGQLGHQSMLTAGIVLVVVGGVSFLVGFAGCCGAIKESKILLGIYIGFLSIILLMQIATGIFVLTEHKKIREYLFKKLDALPDVKKGSSEEGILKAIQKMFDCCGFTKGCSDWYGHMAYGCTCPAVNKECKVFDKTTCVNKDNVAKPMYTTPCYKKTVDFLENHMSAVGGSILGIALAEIFGLVIAILLCRGLKDESYEAY